MPADAFEIRIKQLRTQLQRYDYAYYVLDKPDISDAEYDQLRRELITLEQQHPQLIVKDTPTQQIGGSPSVLPKLAHTHKMFSLDNLLTLEELTTWLNSLRDVLGDEGLEFWVDLKLDGLALEAIYSDHDLLHLLTRGHRGIEGELVTGAQYAIANLPQPLAAKAEEHDVVLPSRLEVRGECVITKANYQLVNRVRESRGEEPFSSPRHAASGIIRSLGQDPLYEDKLSFYGYGIGDVAYPDGLVFTELTAGSYDDTMRTLASWGLAVAPKGRLLYSEEEIVAFYREVMAERDQLPLMIDGIVLKFNRMEHRQILGYTSRAPKWAMALKFPAEKVQTRVKDIEIQVGRTGKLTPVAILHPVDIGGVQVSRATLHNEGRIEDLDLRIGDTVSIERSGDVIPAVLQVHLEHRPGFSAPFHFPVNCPACGGGTTRINADRYCNDPRCPEIVRQKLIHATGRSSLNIMQLGPTLVDVLISNSLVQRVPDLFQLTEEDLLDTREVGPRTAKKVIANIARVKQEVKLPQLIHSLGIPEVGEATSRVLADRFGSLQGLLQATEQELLTISGIGKEMCGKILGFLRDPENQATIAQYIGQGPNPQITLVQADPTNPLYKKNVLATGTLTSMSREKFAELVRSKGGQLHTSLSANTDYVVIGQKATQSKVKKAQAKNIPVLTEKDFFTQLVH